MASRTAVVDVDGRVSGKDGAGGKADVSSTTKGGVRMMVTAEIDTLLLQINGPQNISTTIKTRVTWDRFKDHAGLEEDLKKKALGKDAFLFKKISLD